MEGFVNDVYQRFFDFLIAPYNDPNMLWVVIPLVLAIFLTKLYFGRYKFEEIGWHTAYGNSLVLLFVGMHLLKYLNDNNLIFPFTVEATLTFVLILEGIILLLSNFFHFFPKEFSVSLNSELPLNLVSYIVVVLVYSSFPLDVITVAALVVFVLLVALLAKTLWFLIPETFDEDSF